jgi:hypothetical protein
MVLLAAIMAPLSPIFFGEHLDLKHQSGWRRGYPVHLTGLTINPSKLMALILISSSLQVVSADLSYQSIR